MIFRRTNPEITNEGGPWDEASTLYPYLGGIPKEHKLEFRFPVGEKDYCRVSFRNLEHEKDVTKWQGAQIPYIGIDEVTTFTERQFWYLVSRNRSPCGTPTYLRATCNPVPDDDPLGGWVHELVGWWIGEDGFPNPERSGVIRWLVRVDNEPSWFDTRAEAVAFARQHMSEKDAMAAPKSVTFIPATLDDNAILQEKDPTYRSSLLSLPFVERMRLLGGNWNVKAEAGVTFQREWFNREKRPEMYVKLEGKDGIMPYLTRFIRYWDKAATKGGKGARTAGVLMARGSDGFFYVVDCLFGRWSAHEREKKMLETAELDQGRFGHVSIYIERENNSGGKVDGMWSVSNLAGFDVHLDQPTADKESRANPVSAQCEAKTLRLVEGNWNRAWVDEHVAFPSRIKDIVDATSGAFAKLIGRSGPPKLNRPLLTAVDTDTPEKEDCEELEPLPVSWAGLFDDDTMDVEEYLEQRWRW